MPHISQRKLKKEVFLRITDEFVELVAKTKSSRATRRLLYELMTETERIMFAKRFALVVMINKGFSFETIEKTLKMSPSTVVRFWKKSKSNSFPYIAELMHKAKASKKFWAALESLLRAGMPPMGRGRWRRVLARIDQGRS